MNDLNFLENQNDEMQSDSLKTLATLSKKLKDVRQEIAGAEEFLKILNKQEAQLSKEEIPNLLLSRGLSSISLDCGDKIEIQEKIYVTLPKKDLIKRKEVMRWIIEQGGANIIKRELKIDEPEDSVLTCLKENHICFEDKKDIHSSTLKAWFRSKLGISKNSLQEIEIGDVPKSANLFIYKETKIK